MHSHDAAGGPAPATLAGFPGSIKELEELVAAENRRISAEGDGYIYRLAVNAFEYKHGRLPGRTLADSREVMAEAQRIALAVGTGEPSAPAEPAAKPKSTAPLVVTADEIAKPSEAITEVISKQLGPDADPRLVNTIASLAQLQLETQPKKKGLFGGRG